MSVWRDIIERKITRLCESGVDKRMELSEAIRRFVKPGMSINPVMMQSRPTSALHELCRQFAGKDPGFEFISSSMSGNYLQLAHLGLVRKAIVSFAGEGYPTPGPSPITRWALERGGFEIENWSMLTISQRLLAGALDVPFMPTRSLVGSTMAVENGAAGGYVEIDDPFNPGSKQGIVKAYRPDVAFVFVWAADAAGNGLCFPPFQENVYGALAAKQGVILTAHRIVSCEFIRRHSHLVRIPGEVVLAVSESPYGSHPYGNFSQGIPEFPPYSNDYDFMRVHRDAQKSKEAYDAWVDEWILSVPDQKSYVAKLGTQRIQMIHKSAEADSWKEELEPFAADFDAQPPANAIETMVLQGAQEIARRVKANGYRTVLSGVGQAALMCWLAHRLLREQGTQFALMAETGIYNFDPRPADPFLTNFRNLPTCTMLTDVLETLGMHTCGAANHCLAVIGAGQIDKFGNVNSTRTGDGSFIVGSGGANDIVTSAGETVIVAHQRKQTFVEAVDYITSPGARVRCVISSHGRFEKNESGELVLTGYFASPGKTREQIIEDIQQNCGWSLTVSERLEELPAVDGEALALLRLFDPQRFFLGKGHKPS